MPRQIAAKVERRQAQLRLGRGPHSRGRYAWLRILGEGGHGRLHLVRVRVLVGVGVGVGVGGLGLLTSAESDALLVRYSSFISSQIMLSWLGVGVWLGQG